MKKVVIILVILLAALLIYIWKDKPTEITQTPTTNTNTSFRPDPSSATFSIDEETITLSGGREQNDAGEETKILDEEAYGDLNNDGKQDAAVLLMRSGGGSGVFIYVAAYVSGPVNYKGTNAVFLGDRIAPESISISNGNVTVKYLDRKEDEPFAAEPTVQSQLVLTYRNGELVER